MYMRKIIPAIAITICSAFISNILIAQQQLKSTKLIKDNDIEELYQVIPTTKGYLGLGLKGENALDKKLWLMSMDEKMQMIRSEVLANDNLSTPFKFIQLQNGNTLILAQHETEKGKQSILFCLSNEAKIIWAKSFNMEGNVLFLDMSLTNKNEIIFTGKEFLRGNLSNDNDKLVIMKTNLDGSIFWQKKLDLGRCEINPKNILVDNNQNIVLNGTIIEANDGKVYDTKWFALKMNADGRILHKTFINDFANYNYAKNMIAYNGGYLTVVNNKNYFGEAAIIELTNDLSIKKSFTFDGSPMIFSGIETSGDNIIVAGVFSNTVNDYSPGYILYNPENGTIKAKSSTNLFKHFFITNILNLPKNQFMLSGIGYNENEASDVYMLPFTSDGNSACNLNSYDLNKTSLSLTASQNQIIKEENCKINSEKLEFVASSTGYNMVDICTAPDDYVVNPENNTNWNAWKNNNREAFTIKAPENWLEASPNPSHDKVTVSYKGLSGTDALRITVLSSDGKIIYSEVIKNQDVFDVDISQYPIGNYFFNLYDGRETKVVKVIKE